MKAYLDNAATTPLAKEVIDIMASTMGDTFGNPSSTHAFGRKSKALIENARRNVAKHLNCKPSEIIFTSGGTEADNIAIHSAIQGHKCKRIITTPIEHQAVVQSVESMKVEHNIQVDYVNMDEKGRVDLNHLQELLQEDTKTLVSLMHANNEIGTLLPLKEVSEICQKNNAVFHSDTVQTMGHYPFDLENIKIDYITCAAHKFHGPKGIGFLYASTSSKALRLIQGGGQERGLRGGTENLYGIVGLAKAMDLAYENIDSHIEYVQSVKSRMINTLQEKVEGVEFYGDVSPEGSLYTVLNVCLPATEKASMLLFTLDLKGIAASGGSACSSGANKGSHVLQGINAPKNRPNVRFSFSRYTTVKEIDYAVNQVVEVYSKILV